MHIVIGSGPAGVFAARALVERGMPVTLLDTGYELEPERRRVVDTVASRVPTAWTRELTADIRTREAVSDRGVKQKLVHGSDFAYRQPAGLSMACASCTVFPSHSRGGHSNVWGGALLPYRRQDVASWPIDVVDLEPGYRHVLDTIPYCAVDDDLGSLFELHGTPDGATPASRQGQELLQDLSRHRSALAEDGIRAGAARLALRPPTPNGGCQQCGMCLHGCPYDQVYSTRWTLTTLLADERFRYIPGVVVDRITEVSDSVEVHAREEPTGAPVRFRGEAVYVGAGVLGTARILMRSLALETPLELRSSEHFLLPFLRYRAVAGVTGERLHTLSQAFVEVMDGDQVRAHLQFYGYNDFYEQALAARLGGLARFLRVPVRTLLSRLFAVQGYLHSDVSSRVRIAWNPRHPGVLALEGIDEPRARNESAAIQRLLFAHRKHLRGIPLAFAMSHGQPGSGAHLGGSFPMCSNPSKPYETDTLGRPSGWRRLHIVDASVLPTIPPTTITLTVMANAYRIAAESLARAPELTGAVPVATPSRAQ